MKAKLHLRKETVELLGNQDQHGGTGSWMNGNCNTYNQARTCGTVMPGPTKYETCDPAGPISAGCGPIVPAPTRATQCNCASEILTICYSAGNDCYQLRETISCIYCEARP